MNKPRIFLGSSGKQAKLLAGADARARGRRRRRAVDDVVQPGRPTLDRLVELTARGRLRRVRVRPGRLDDATRIGRRRSPARPRRATTSSSRPGLFGGALGMRRTFILHANGAKLPTDLLGLTVRPLRPGRRRRPRCDAINQKLRKAIEDEGRARPHRGLWWQLSLTMRTERRAVGGQPAADLARSRRRPGGRRAAPGRRTARSRRATGARRRRSSSDPSGVFYFWKGERPRHPNAPQLEGTGEIRLETADRAAGYWTTRSDRDPDAERAHVRRLPARRSRRPRRPRRRERGRARRAHREAPRRVEVRRERVLSSRGSASTGLFSRRDGE